MEVLGEVEQDVVEVERVLVEVEPDRVVDEQVLNIGIAIPRQHANLSEISEPSWPYTSACSPRTMQSPHLRNLIYLNATLPTRLSLPVQHPF